MTFSRSTVDLLTHLLSQVQIPATVDNIEEVAGHIATARRELAEAAAALEADSA